MQYLNHLKLPKQYCLQHFFAYDDPENELIANPDAPTHLLFNMATGSNSCVKYDEKLKFAPRFLRGPAAEYYIARDFELPSWKAKGKPLAVYQMPTNAELDKLDADAKADVVMTEIGSCVAKANPAGSADPMPPAPVTTISCRACRASCR